MRLSAIVRKLLTTNMSMSNWVKHHKNFIINPELYKKSTETEHNLVLILSCAIELQYIHVTKLSLVLLSEWVYLEMKHRAQLSLLWH